MLDWNRLEALMHQDPGRRGLPSARRAGDWLDAGELERAAPSLAGSPGGVGLLTGFYLPDPRGWVPETDGPPGVLFLAECLTVLGHQVTLLGEPSLLEVLERAAEPARWRGYRTLAVAADDWASATANPGDRPIPAGLAEQVLGWKHLISVERIGRSHDPASLARQGADGETRSRFRTSVAEHHWGRLHSMRGELVPEDISPAWDALFEVARHDLGLTTIGIGDGGNELGMGRFDWRELAVAIAGGDGGTIACRTATTRALIAGCSNWGAWALGWSALALSGRAEELRFWDGPYETALLGRMVAAGARDGVTGRAEPTVDALPRAEYLAPLDEIRRLVLID